MLIEFSSSLLKNYRILPILFRSLRASSQASENTVLGITEWFSPSLMIQYSLPESDTVEKLTSTDCFRHPVVHSFGVESYLSSLQLTILSTEDLKYQSRRVLQQRAFIRLRVLTAIALFLSRIPLFPYGQNRSM